MSTYFIPNGTSYTTLKHIARITIQAKPIAFDESFAIVSCQSPATQTKAKFPLTVIETVSEMDRILGIIFVQ